MQAIFYRDAVLDDDIDQDDSEDGDELRAKLSFSSELPVLRMDGDLNYLEVLSHGPGDCNLSLLNSEGVVLGNHDHKREIGSVVPGSARVEADRKCRATIEIDPTHADSLDRARNGGGVSVGYTRNSVVGRGKNADGIEIRRYSWTPFEISILDQNTPAADDSVGVGRAKFMNSNNADNQLTEDNDGSFPPLNRAERRAQIGEDRRVRAIQDAVSAMLINHPHLADEMNRMASQAILGNTPAQTFNAKVMALIQANPPQRQFVTVDDRVGMNSREIGRYSLLKAVQSCIRRKTTIPEGFEGEIHQECERKFRNSPESPEGFYLPIDIYPESNPEFRRSLGRRDMTAGVFGNGGAFVQTTLLSSPIELLRNRAQTLRLGVQAMGGLQGNVAIPRQTAAAVAQSVPETTALTVSNQVIDQIPLTPHRVGAVGKYSKQLLLQSSVDVENWIRDDLMKVTALRHDYLILQGAGANSEPLGIMNTPGIGSVIFGGPASWTSILQFENALAVTNADVGSMAYLTTPNVRMKLKGAPKVTGATPYPIFIWERGNWNDGSNDGEVNQYRAAITNQLLNNGVMFANWNDGISALWGGYDVVVNPYTFDVNAEVQITVNTFMDFCARHAASFCLSADAGNQ